MSDNIKEGKFIKGGRNPKPNTPRPPAPKAQKPSKIILSDKEQKLYDSIVTRKAGITVKLIETELGKPYVGALGRLLNLGIVKSEKRNLEVETGKDLNPYGHKWTKCYFIEEKK